MLPLVDLFCNKKVKFDVNLSNIKILFKNLGLPQNKPVFCSFLIFETVNNSLNSLLEQFMNLIKRIR